MIKSKINLVSSEESPKGIPTGYQVEFYSRKRTFSFLNACTIIKGSKIVKEIFIFQNQEKFRE